MKEEMERGNDGPSGNRARQEVNEVMTVPTGKIRCYIHDGRFWRDTPEEHVRQRVARSLVEEYGFNRSDIHLEVPVKIGGGRKKRIDIGIFPPGQTHDQDHVFIIVEAKRENITPTDREEGVAQLKSYMAACVNARWGLWVGSEMKAFRKEMDQNQARSDPFPETIDIPLKGETEPKKLEFADLVPATDGLSAVFKRCHNYLHVNGSLSKEKSFFELLKLIFCKFYDEQETSGSLEFSISSEERHSDLGQRKLRARIDRLFTAVKDRYPYIFPESNEKIELDNRSLAYCVAELQKYSLMQTPNDVKGEAYEEIVGVTSRRDQGAFFTPRTVCDMAVRMVSATYPSEQRLKLKVLDPACGTGGFLRAELLEIKAVIAEQERVKRKRNPETIEPEIGKRLKAICDQNIFGIDKLAELVRAAQMNLALHGDGSSNVFCTSSLLPPGEWPEGLPKQIGLERFDVVFTNPPFGSRLPIDDPHILDQYELTQFEAKNPRSSLPPEQLFIERCLGFLKPGGRMAVVLPDSILSNPGLMWLRNWILQKAWIIASIDLPREMFAKSDTHTMTSVLVLQKFTVVEREAVIKTGRTPKYEVFMAIAEHVGWDLRGQPVYLRTPDGEFVIKKNTKTFLMRNGRGQVEESHRQVEERVLNDDLPLIVDLFKNWLKETTSNGWRTNS